MLSLLSIVAMLLAIRGSSNDVRGDFESGSWQFMTSYIINMAIGLAIGNLWLFLAHASLMFYTLNLVSVKRKQRYTMLLLFAILIVSLLGVADIYRLSYYNLIDILATFTTIYGAYARSKQNWSVMVKMWIIASICFLWIAIDAGLIGLAIQSAIFTYDGYLRLNNKTISAIW